MNKANGIDILDKKQFWEPLFKDCPDIAEKFEKWIDEYKKSVSWSKLFPPGNRIGIYPHNIKFHHLPTAMQVGIVLEFADQILRLEYPAHLDEDDEGIQDMITLIFHNWSDKYQEKKKADEDPEDDGEAECELTWKD